MAAGPCAPTRAEVWWSLTPTLPVVPWVAVALMALQVEGPMAAVVGRMAGREPGPGVPVRFAVC